MRDFAYLIGVLAFSLLLGFLGVLIFGRKKKVEKLAIPSTATPECPSFESKALEYEDSWKSLMREKIRKHAKIITVRENKKLIDVNIMERAIREAAKEYAQLISEDKNDKSA